MKPSRAGLDVCSVYAVTEREKPEVLRIDRLLVLYEDGTNVTLLGGKPIRWKVIPGDEQFVKVTLLMLACRGDEGVMMNVSPDHIYQITTEEFGDILRRFAGGVVGEER